MKRVIIYTWSDRALIAALEDDAVRGQLAIALRDELGITVYDTQSGEVDEMDDDRRAPSHEQAPIRLAVDHDTSTIVVLVGASGEQPPETPRITLMTSDNSWSCPLCDRHNRQASLVAPPCCSGCGVSFDVQKA
jgi:hypothetical protein